MPCIFAAIQIDYDKAMEFSQREFEEVLDLELACLRTDLMEQWEHEKGETNAVGA